MTKTLRLTCVSCPKGCDLEVSRKGKSWTVSGNQCAQGETYALKEMENPARVLCTTVKTVFADFPRLPVRTDREIPLAEVFLYMEEINRAVAERRYTPGEAVVSDLRGGEVNLLATDDMTVYE